MSFSRHNGLGEEREVRENFLSHLFSELRDVRALHGSEGLLERLGGYWSGQVLPLLCRWAIMSVPSAGRGGNTLKMFVKKMRCTIDIAQRAWLSLRFFLKNIKVNHLRGFGCFTFIVVQNQKHFLRREGDEKTERERGGLWGDKRDGILMHE